MPRSGDLNGLLANSDFYLYGAWSICRFTYVFARSGALFAISLIYLQFAYLFANSTALFAISLIYLQVQPLYLQIQLLYLQVQLLYLQFRLFASSAALFAKLFSTKKSATSMALSL
ncbi:hypothetical protein [Cytobacillus firmus]|uniref:hypothetical protein n=1 Tax=Cytobacillus firmus TaxID=1399 RepID=UPI002162F874|nr:hypothetical protein [Cytobacillus firmus]MCS0669786.1 hypothetical protein [Cytobacillus firmus]